MYLTLFLSFVLLLKLLEINQLKKSNETVLNGVL